MKRADKLKVNAELVIPFTERKGRAKPLINIFTRKSRASLDLTKDSSKKHTSIFGNHRFSEQRPADPKPAIRIRTITDIIPQKTLKSIRKAGCAFSTPGKTPERPMRLQNIQFELIQKLKRLDHIESAKRPSKERITAILDALQKACEEKSIFQDYMQKLIDEIKHAIYFYVGEFPVLFNFDKIECEEANILKDLERKEMTFFDALTRVIEIFDSHVYKTKSTIKKLEAMIEEIAQKKQDEVKETILKRLEEDIEELRKNNSNPIFQQYVTISEENAKLRKEYNLLKYKVIELQEDRDNLARNHQEELTNKKTLTGQINTLKQENETLENENKTLKDKCAELVKKLEETERNTKSRLKTSMHE